MSGNFLYIEGVIVAEYQIGATSMESDPLPLLFPDNFGIGRVVLSSADADITFNFGDETVVASATPDGTSKALPAGNFTIPDGAIFQTNIDKLAPFTQPTYVSVITATGSGTATIKIVKM